jgi:hypothetical protein
MIHRVNARVWNGNISNDLSKEIQKATQSKKSNAILPIVHTGQYWNIIKTEAQQ